MSDDLGPCPFCGGVAALRGEAWWAADCHMCGARGALRNSKAGAAEAWNGRAKEPDKPQKQPDGRQLARVRIAVAVDKHGFWSARGEGVDGTWLEEPNYYALESVDGLPRICPHDPCNGMCPISGPDVHHVVWVTAIVPLPPGEVQGEVEA